MGKTLPNEKFCGLRAFLEEKRMEEGALRPEPKKGAT